MSKSPKPDYAELNIWDLAAQLDVHFEDESIVTFSPDELTSVTDWDLRGESKSIRAHERAAARALKPHAAEIRSTVREGNKRGFIITPWIIGNQPRKEANPYRRSNADGPALVIDLGGSSLSGCTCK